MNTSRSLERKKERKHLKEAKQQIKNVEKLVNSVEKKCCSCFSIFDPKVSPNQLDEWHIEVYDDHVKLYCESCFNKHNI